MQFKLGETIRVDISIKDLDGNAKDATTVTVTVYNSLSTAVITGAATVHVTTGEYYYNAATVTTWVPGIYTIRVSAVFSDGTVYEDFEVEAVALR